MGLGSGYQLERARGGAQGRDLDRGGLSGCAMVKMEGRRVSKTRFVSFRTRAGVLSADRKTGAWYLTDHGRTVDYGVQRDIPALLTMFKRPDFSALYAEASMNGGD